MNKQKSHDVLRHWKWSDGIGHLPLSCVEPVPYDQTYFDRYIQYSKSEVATILNQYRADLVTDHAGHLPAGSLVLDVGIGAGDFVSKMKSMQIRCMGTDVNPVALEWLRSRSLLWDGRERPAVATFWDVLEHIEDIPGFLIQTVHRPKLLLVSMPIYTSEDHCLSSKHFKPGEHCWYFTEAGFVRFMLYMGYKTIHIGHGETVIGRDGITSFALELLWDF